MKWRMTASSTRLVWDLLRDIALTGTGITVIFSQVFSAHPSGLLLGTGLALTVPSVAEHVRALLPSGGGDASPSSPAHGQQLPSGSPPEGSGE